MSRAEVFAVRLLRALEVGGRRYLAGATLHVDAETAADLIVGGAALLKDSADLPLLADAVRAAGRLARAH